MATRTLIAERAMQARTTDVGQWMHEPFEARAGAFAARIPPAGKRLYCFSATPTKRSAPLPEAQPFLVQPVVNPV